MITQLAQNKETWPEFVDSLCSARHHGAKCELKLENARTNPDTAICSDKLGNVFNVQVLKMLFSSDKFSPVVSDSNPVLRQTVQLLLAI